MELTCELSPLVFAELYRLLGGQTTWSDTLEERLGEGGFDDGWLHEVAAHYNRKWDDIRFTDPEYVLPERHAQLASWLLASLQLKGPSSDLSADLRDAVDRRFRAETPITGARPSAFATVVVAWTLGKVVGEYDAELPVVPATWPTDAEVSAAYRGLVEHVVHLGEVATPWTEMLGTSTYWRGAGLAEALRPDEVNAGASIGKLISEAKPLLPLGLKDQIDRHWQRDFIAKRNVLTHIRPESGVLFSTLRKTAADHQSIRLTLLGVTHFIFQQVSTELVDDTERTPWATIWGNQLWYDVAVWS